MENEDNYSGWCAGSDGDSTGCSPPNAGGLRMTPRQEFGGHSRKPSASSLGAFTGPTNHGTDSGFESGTPQSRVSSAPIQVVSQNQVGPNRSPPGSFFHSDPSGLVDMSPVHPFPQRRTPVSNP